MLPLQDQYEQHPKEMVLFGSLALALVGREQQVQQAWRVLHQEVHRSRSMPGKQRWLALG